MFEDDCLIVLDKAAGILVQSSARGREYSVQTALANYVRKGQSKSKKQVFLVHRLDRETSGVMMVAKTPETMEYFRSRWNEITQKTYVAVVCGAMENDSGVFKSYLLEDERTLSVRSVPKGTPGAKLAISEWRVLERLKNATRVEVKLKSGRKHQIRVQFAEAGHPVLGDTRYSRSKAPRLMLHSAKLAFIHPATGQTMEFSARTAI